MDNYDVILVKDRGGKDYLYTLTYMHGGARVEYGYRGGKMRVSNKLASNPEKLVKSLTEDKLKDGYKLDGSNIDSIEITEARPSIPFHNPQSLHPSVSTDLGVERSDTDSIGIDLGVFPCVSAMKGAKLWSAICALDNGYQFKVLLPKTVEPKSTIGQRIVIEYQETGPHGQPLFASFKGIDG